MAGLLDFGSNPYAGLLSEEDLAGARRQATTDALLKLSSGLFQAGAPSRTPQGLGAALVGGLQGVGAGYQGTLQQAAQQKLMQQKLQADLQSKQRAANAQKLVGGLYRPAQAATQGIMDSPDVVVPPRPATPGGINQDVMSQLMALGPEGQKAIMDRLGMQKMMQGEAFNLSPGDVRSRTDIFGNTTQVAAGSPKVDKPELASSFAGAVDALGLPRKNASEYTEAERTKINKEMARQRAESKMSIAVNMPSEGERKAATLASRMNFSVGQMMEAVGKDPTAAKPDTIAEAARFLSQSDWLPNKLNSTQRQIVEAAQEDILDAALTLGTGAAYTREQLAGYKKSYFPQLNDDEATVRSKQARLQNLLETAQLASGRAANQIPTPIPSPTNLSNISLSDLIAERKRRQAEKDKR